MAYECDECSDWFNDLNELREHEQIHLPADYECFNCNNCYRKYSDMISHMEYGCGGENAEDLNKTAALCFQWKKFLDPLYRSDFLGAHAEYGRSWNHDGQPWKCPNCGKWFRKLSGLFQHVWSAYGAEEENEGAIGKLKKWLGNRHG